MTFGNRHSGHRALWPARCAGERCRLERKKPVNNMIKRFIAIGLPVLLIAGPGRFALAEDDRQLDARKITAARIEQMLGHKSQAKDGVVKVSIGREGTMDKVKVGEPMGLNTWAAFSGADDYAAVDGDFIMAGDEVQPVLRALRKSGIYIVALHNHMIGEQPPFY